MKLIEDWKQAWTWFSVHALAILAILPMVWLNLPADVKTYIPTKYGLIVVMLVAIGGIAGRVIDQKPKT
jgi:uncharacterized membrane protein